MAALTKNAMVKCHGRVDRVELDRAADRVFVLRQLAGLHQGRVQVEIVRHDGGPDDADGDNNHLRVAKRRQRRDQRQSHLGKIRLDLRQHENLNEVADRDGQHQAAARWPRWSACRNAARPKEQQHVETRDEHRPQQRNVESHEVQRHGAAQHLGQVARADGHFAKQPIGPACPARGPVAAALGEVLARHHAQPRGDDLHEDGHQARHADDPQQPVPELRPALQIGAPVAGIHVADADEDGRPGKGPPLPPETGPMLRHADGTMYILQRTGGRRGRPLRRLRHSATVIGLMHVGFPRAATPD